MTKLRSLSLPVAAVLLAWLGAPRSAHALDACADDANCGQGFECRIVGGSDCAVPACPPDAPCEPVACEPTVEKACVPASCSVDSDCADGMVCHEWSRSGGCVAANCACDSETPDCSCPEPVCEAPTVEKICTPRYVLPCRAAADCGADFTCEEQQSCGCSGSPGSGGASDPIPGAAPTPAGDGGAEAPAAPAPDCSCEPSGEFVCVPTEIVCTSDSGCPDGWRCSVAEPDEPAGSGDQFPAGPVPQPSQRLCAPDHYDGIAGGVDDGGIPTNGGDDGNGSGKGGAEGPELADDGSAESKDSSACQLGRAPASGSSLLLLTLLGALASLAQRRAQPRP